ncbi:Pentatricopeptide repeat-containing protein [Camellia lanceoleosa]|uniref:Pentatricopeptide repeat-containing protein n=1 Tax=Camellia lanceoleosa TaxID=1840588 RepID=A0ACC0J4X6_9ERIC|nr:Pentatricopeptide repeat-containing protein [Camellia lanceoleosa]
MYVQGKPKESSFPLELSIFMPILEMVLILTALWIRSQKTWLEFDVFVSNVLINMYAKFGNIRQAQKVFDQMFVRDLVLWNWCHMSRMLIYILPLSSLARCSQMEFSLMC